MNKKISIVVPILNNFKGAVEALESVRTAYEWQPILIDNWRTNRCLSAAWNKGIDIAIKNDSDYILVINDDILFAPYTIDNLIATWENCSNPEEIVMITACNDRGYIDSIYSSPYGIFELPYKDLDFSLPEHPDFSCFMVKPSILDTVGHFDENFIPAYWEDNEMHYRINLSGHKAVCTASAPYYHYGSQTQKSEDFHKSFRENREYYIQKWGGLPNSETFVYPFNDSSFDFKDEIPFEYRHKIMEMQL